MFVIRVLWFYYHLGLHYSQTKLGDKQEVLLFYYHLGLHYSQTAVNGKIGDH